MQKMANYIATVIALSVALATEISAGPNDWNLNERLRNDLLKSYSKETLPKLGGPNDTVNVYFGLMLKGMWIEEEKQILQINAWVIMAWSDERLHWDPKDYGQLQMLHLADHEVWQPDLMLYNNADISDIDHYGNTQVIVFSDGWVNWIPPGNFRVECPLDFTYWPYDTHTCHIFIGSWTYHGWQVNLELLRNKTDITQGWFGKYSNEWKFVSGKVRRESTKYPCCPEPYVVIHGIVTLQRVSGTFTATIVIPACVISVLTLIQFLLPVREKKRLIIGCCCILLTLLELLYLAFTIPRLSTSTPMIVTFYGQTLAVVVASVAVTAVVIRLTDIEYPAATTPPPDLLKGLVAGPLASLLFLQHYTEKVGRSGGGDEDGEVLDSSKNSLNYGPDWLLVAAVIDRLAAIAFVLAFVITLICYVAPV